MTNHEKQRDSLSRHSNRAANPGNSETMNMIPKEELIKCAIMVPRKITERN